MSNRDTVLSMLEEISESPEADDYFELEKNYGNDIHWMLGAAKDKNIKRAVRDTKSRALEGTLNLALEDSNGVDYSSLMNQYKRAFKWGLRFSKSAKIRGKIKELKRRALVETAKKLSKDEKTMQKKIIEQLKKDKRFSFDGNLIIKKENNAKYVYDKHLH